MAARTPGLLAALLIAPLPVTAGWTDLPQAPGALLVYVSSSVGNNANDGLSEATPKATIAAGFALLRNGQADRLLLKRGDTFPMSATLIWNKSGASAQYPMVFGAYGAGARPVIDPGGGEALHVSPGFQSANTVRHLALVGLRFRSAQRDFTQPGFDIAGMTLGGAGIRIVGSQTTAPQIMEDLLVEDCMFEFLEQPLILEGPYFDGVRDVRMRRNVIVDTYSTRGHTNGVFVSNVRGLLMEENLVDGVQRAPGLDPALASSSLSHAVYGQSTSRDLTLRNNIFVRAFDGGMMRPGGVYEDNLVADVDIGNHQGFMYSPSSAIITEGIAARVTGNAFLDVGLNQGVNAGNLRQGVIDHNLILSGASTGGMGISLIGSTNLGQVGVHDLVIEDNFILGLRAVSSYGASISNVTVRGNQFRASNSEIVDLGDYESGDFHFTGNAYRSQSPANRWFRIDASVYYDLAGWAAFVGESGATTASFMDPATAPDVEGYHASIGGSPTLTAFLAEARQQSGQSWRDAYTAAPVIDYLRQQLGLGPVRALTIDDRAVLEGSAANAAFRVTLSAASSQAVTVQFTTADATAAAGSDYAATSGTLTFTPGRTQQSIFVPIVTDTVAEGNETFSVSLTSPTNATIARGQALGTIGDPPAAVKPPMYRAYNRSTDYHFFTTDLNSKNFAVVTLGFQDESNPIPFYVWNVLQTGTLPLFRMYNPNLGRHYYTADTASRDFLMSIGMIYEKDEGFIYASAGASGTAELFRLYNNNSGTHLFTADAGQRNAILGLFPGIWVQHTSVGYVYTSP